jgi:3-oxoacyl-[acyl-carrier protein] reductase
VVAGSTSGLGLAVARALAAEAANVVPSGRRGDTARAEAKRPSGAVGVGTEPTEPASFIKADHTIIGPVMAGLGGHESGGDGRRRRIVGG